MMNNTTSRNRILSRLNAAPRPLTEFATIKNMTSFREFTREEKIERLKNLMEAMRTEVYVTDSGRWVEILTQLVRKKGLKNLLYSPRTDVGAILEKHWKGLETLGEKPPELIHLEGSVEDFKQQLFHVEAAITTSKGAVADAGAIILWPTEHEPRLMSLVPPVHFAVLDANTIYSNLSEAMENENWRVDMPTNALLISGPSKTADIELILAFGVHGPKELIVIIVD